MKDQSSQVVDNKKTGENFGIILYLMSMLFFYFYLCERTALNAPRRKWLAFGGVWF